MPLEPVPMLPAPVPLAPLPEALPPADCANTTAGPVRITDKARLMNVFRMIVSFRSFHSVG
jgi:hypothetical protein